jgi:hypothetical protein
MSKVLLSEAGARVRPPPPEPVVWGAQDAHNTTIFCGPFWNYIPFL